MSDSEDGPQLSSATFAALQEFYKEQEMREEKMKQIMDTAAKSEGNDIDFEENWQLSQFWYDESTTETLIKTALKCISNKGKIALISCPTLFKKMKEKLQEGEVKLFEYDERFAVYGNDFAFYDYKSPLDIPRDLRSYFDLVIADPPFLSEECLTKTAVTVKYLAKDKILICTGEIMAELAQKLFSDVKKCKYVPKHKNNLANQFSCFANFEFDSLLTYS